MFQTNKQKAAERRRAITEQLETLAQDEAKAHELLLKIALERAALQGELRGLRYA